MKRRDFLKTIPALPLLANLPAANAAEGYGETPAAPASVSNPEEEAALIAASVERRAKDPRPNILLIFTDQQTWDAMSCAGNPHVSTPSMDFLAAHGTRFPRAYCNSPVCGPSRASMLTGRLPHENKVRFNADTPAAEIPLVGELLEEAGYQTVWSGKWHLPESFPKTPRIRGFRNLALPDGLPALHLGDVTDMTSAQAAARFLRWDAAKSDKPWFVGLSLHNPHDICHYFNPPKSPLAVRELDPEARKADSLPPLPANFEPDPNEPDMLKERRTRGELAETRDITDQHWRAYLDRYYRLTESVDRCLPPVLDAISENGWLENTLIIFTSDHGEGMASHRWNTKLGFYEPIVRVPMIVVPPGGFKNPRPQVDAESLVSLLDVVPTLLDYAQVPEAERPPLLGQSLRPALEGKPLRDNAVVVELDPLYQRRGATARMVVTPDGWKYCVFSDGEKREQLFDLNKDPLEKENLAEVAGAASQLARLRTILRQECQATNDPFLPLIP